MKDCTCDRYTQDEINVNLMPEKDDTERVSLLFKTLADPTRIRILFALKSDELCVCNIAFLLSMSQSAISHQLKVLRDTDLVRTRKSGKSVFYRLADEHVHMIFQKAYDHVREEH